MSPDAGQDAREDVTSDPITVLVEHNARGWQVTLPGDACPDKEKIARRPTDG